MIEIKSKTPRALGGEATRLASLLCALGLGLLFVGCSGDGGRGGEEGASTCGDGIVQDGEECDDGDLDETDECTTLCLLPRCGDGFVQDGEQCDDANFSNNDYCLNDCTAASCGDGYQHVGIEACDDGNDIDTDECRNDCSLPTCGDGVVQDGEQCDDGNLDETDECTSMCLPPACGDGFVQDGEECDDGNFSNNDYCLNDCTAASCGDGYLNLELEECDDGNLIDDDGCRADCTLPDCGDGVVQDGEQCDDGNQSNSDSCLDNCQQAYCGDGEVWLGVEECDDGNLAPGDGCSPNCTLPACGDGVVQPPEECDDGNALNTDGCLNTCQLPWCGDGFVQPGEECDDGNGSDNDACLTDCTQAYCGDGVVWSGVEACDDGNDIDTDECRNDCSLPTCGDGVVQPPEECDDANLDNTDGCLMNCLEFDWCEQFDIESIEPPVVCTGQVPAQLTLSASGLGFLEIEGEEPAVSWDGTEITGALVDSTCQSIYGVMIEARACTSMTIEVPTLPDSPGDIADYEITVTNPVTQDCTATALYSVAPAPSIDTVNPQEVCSDTEIVLDITGSDFMASTQVWLTHQETSDEYPADSTSVASDGTSMQATWESGLPAGDYDLTVSNGEGCESTLLGALSVYPRPIIFFIDPPVIYNAIDFQATLYVANINGGAISEVLARRLPSGTFEVLDHTYDPEEPWKVQVTFPAGMVGPGEQFSYEVTLEDALGCEATLNGVVDLTQVVTLADFELRPPFGGATSSTPISIVIEDTSSGDLFQEIPRVYLNPTTGGGMAKGLKSVGFLDATELSAVVPAGMSTGEYQAIVVNPDGTVGVSDPPIPGGFTVKADDPPVIDYIAPGSVPGAGSTVYVFGENLDGTAVTLICRAPDDTVAEFDGTAISTETYGLTFEVPNGITENSVCVVRAINADDAYSDYSALVFLNPAENILPGAESAHSMNSARRAPVSLVGNVTRTSRFLYALGGDDGSAAGATASCEAAPLSPFGEIKGDFEPLPIDLPEERTLAQGASIGRFIYVVGGDDGTGPVESGYRAEVLQIDDAPEITGDLSIDLEPDGIGPGLWYYRVSAVMDATDPDNPGGETLPSEALPITVPSWAPDDFQVTLRWSPVPGAASYRVYRSPAADDSLSEVALIGSTSAGDPGITSDDVLELTDDGLTAGAQLPRKQGDLGEWIALPQMGEARAAFGLAVGTDPVDDNVKYLYAVGGDDGSGPLGTYEYLDVTIQADGSQQVGSWSADATNTFDAKQECSAYTVDAFVAPPPTFALDETWIYIGPGNGSGFESTRFQSAAVQAGGQLSSWILAFLGDVSISGYGGVAVSSQVYTLGGLVEGTISANRQSGFVEAGGTLTNINDTPGDLAVARELMGCTLGSGRIFLVGGNTSSGPTDSVESMVW
ncbi:MAG: DUF4215 domain-containing protein [Polyangia bacterium]